MTRLRRIPGSLPLLLCLLLVGATLGGYSQVRHHDFITFDDNMYVTENLMVRAGFTSRHLRFFLLSFSFAKSA